MTNLLILLLIYQLRGAAPTFITGHSRAFESYDVVTPRPWLESLNSSPSRPSRRLLEETLTCSEAEQNSKFTPSGISLTILTPDADEPSKSKKFLESMTSRSNWNNTAFLKDTLTNYLIYRCELDSETESPRCVLATDPSAALDINGNCISSSDSTCSSGTCERTSNCYWLDPVPGQPRERRYTDDEASAASVSLYTVNDSSTYLWSCGKYLYYSLIISLVSMFLWLFFFLGRCCCKSLNESFPFIFCSPVPRKSGYNLDCEVKVAIYIFLFTVLLVLVSLAMVHFGDSGITTSVDGFTSKAIQGLSSTQEYLGVVSAPIVAMGNFSAKARTHSQRLYEQHHSWTEHGPTGLEGSMQDFYAIYKGGIGIAGTASEFNASVAAVNSSIGPMVSEISGALETLQVSLVHKKASVDGALQLANNKLAELNTSLTGFYNNIEYIETTMKDYSEHRRITLLVLTIVVLTCSALGVLAVFTYWTSVAWDDVLIQGMNATWFLGSAVCLITIPLAGLTTFLALFINDSCVMVDFGTANFEPIMGSSAAAPIQACFGETGLISSALNLSSALGYRREFEDNVDYLQQVGECRFGPSLERSTNMQF